MPESKDSNRSPALSALLCVDADALARLGSVLRHLLVGLVDQAVPIRVLSSSPGVERLSLPAVPLLTHPPLVWPLGSARFRRLVEQLDPAPPTVVIAAGHESYPLASMLALEFDVDFAVSVTSAADADSAGTIENPRIDRVLVSSTPLQSWVESRSKIPSERVRLVRPGLPASSKCAAYSQPHRTASIVCTTTFHRASGVGELISAADLLHRQGRDFMLFLLGAGRLEAKLRTRVRERKLTSRVSFADPLSDPSAVLQNADIFVAPAAENAFAADSLQAMGLGCAVVAVKDDVNDHFIDNETSFLCEQGDAKSFAEALDRLLTDRSAAQSLAIRGMEYVRANHAVSVMAEKTAAALRELALSQSTLSLSGPSTLA